MRFNFTKRAAALFCAILCAATLAGCAQQTSQTATATITYVTGTDEFTISPLTAGVGSKIYPPEDPVRDGYRFEGWTLDGAAFTFDTMPETDITLTAVWSELYTLTFDRADGSAATTVQYAEGDAIVLPEAPTRAHFKFTGWTLDGKPLVSGTMPNGDVTLTASWAAASTIYFVTGVDGLTVEPLVEIAGTEISAPASPDRQGYYLRRWLLNGAAYDFSVMPDSDVTLTAEWIELTNLPAMFIDLSDGAGNTVALADVTREAYVTSSISLTNTSAEYELDSVASQFKGRGNGSWTDSGDKKGYKIKFDKKQSLFGRTANKHWVILACSNFNDVTMCRNYLAYNMADELFDDIEYSTNAEWIDVYVNGEYRGVYVLCEHVRVAEGRVDIESEYGVLDTGYLVEYDAYAEGVEGVDYFRLDGLGLKYAFTVHSPDPEDYMEEGNISKAAYMRQVAYIKDYVTRVYSAALNGDYNTFSELADVDSFVDMYILSELFKNVDTGYSSFYLYKKPNGKLYAGPPWDFDATTNIGERGDRTPTGIYVADSVQWGSSNCASELYISLYQQSGFKNAVKARWKVLSPKISAFIEEKLNVNFYDAYRSAMGKNFAKWAGKSQATAEYDWVNDVKTLKQWLLDRVDWLDSEWV